MTGMREGGPKARGIGAASPRQLGARFGDLFFAVRLGGHRAVVARDLSIIHGTGECCPG